MATFHPMPNDDGKPVALKTPSQPSSLAAWLDPSIAATVIPGGAVPDQLNGIPFAQWRDVPDTHAGWNRVPGQLAFEEPAFKLPAGMAAAAGVVIEEADGRIWLVSPSNAFGGYTTTFPKGRVEGDVNMQASAIREALEEAGLQVRITGFLADSARTQTFTRYYLGQRVGGSPALMGWESQAVHLVPMADLAAFLTHPNDQPLIEALVAASGR
jgi:8-oxo-dGTP pyrophosphatase MutT (NUDIX family)